MSLRIFTDEEYGDWVYCANCENEMVVNCGEEDCPVCMENGNLMWMDEDKPEVNVKDIQETRDVVEEETITPK